MSDELEPWHPCREPVGAFIDRAIAAGGIPTFAPVIYDDELELASGAVMPIDQPLETIALSPKDRVRAFGAIYAIGRLYRACEALGATPAAVPSGDGL